jgi:hypothetical protein
VAAPYWERFCTPLAERILALIRTPAGGGDAADAGTFILEESVDAVLADGRYQIGADALRTKGTAALRVGQRVHVLWRGSSRVVILTHQWQRAQGATWQLAGGGVVEVLFIADGAVWFWNDQQVAAVLDPATAGWDAPPVFVRWGIDGQSFVVMTRRTTFYVYALDRATPTQLYGARPPAVTRLATHTPLEDGLVLYTLSETSTVTGETRYFGLGEWNYPTGDWTEPVEFLGEVDVKPMSRVVTRTGPIVLTRVAVEGQTAPIRQPSMYLTDVSLDAQRHVVLCLAVNTVAQPAPPGTDTTSRPLWQWYPIPGTTVEGEVADDPPFLIVGRTYNHLIVVDATSQSVLWRTCLPLVRTEVVGEEHRFHTIKGVKGGSPTVETDYGTVYQAPTGTTVRQAWLQTSPGTGAAAEYTVVSGYPTPTSQAGVTSYRLDEYAALPYIDPATMFSVETQTTVTEHGFRWYADGGFQSSPLHLVRVTRQRRRHFQAKRWGFSGVYLPRPQAADGTYPPGRVVVVVAEERNPTGGFTWTAGQQGAYVHDLAAATVTPLLPMTPGVTYTQGVHLTTAARAFFFLHQIPATEPVVTVLGFDGDHLLWLHRHPNYVQADVKLTELSSGSTKVVQTGSGDVAGGGIGSASGLSPEVRAVLDLQLQALPPGVMYEPTQQQQFVDAYDAHGAPTLDATVPGFPPIEEALRDQGPLTEGATPTLDTPAAVNGGPINLVLAETGPSYYAVPVEAVTRAAETLP